jgi:cystathionine gamma-synthase
VVGPAPPAIAAVLYPGLEDHPGYAIAQAQMAGGTGVAIDTGEGRAIGRFSGGGRHRLFTQATSFGGPHSTLEHRASVEAPTVEPLKNLLRLSIGLEHPEDLIADLEASLQLVI